MKFSFQDKTTFKKLAYTLMVVIFTLVISHIPVYGIDNTVIKEAFSSTSFSSFVDMLSGGALGNLTIGGFGVTSLIMAGIIVQLLGIIIPSIQELQNDGEYGRIMFDKIQFGIAIGITILLSLAVSIFGKTLFTVQGFWRIIPCIEWMLGSSAIIILAQSIHENGMGQGPTIVLSANIAQNIHADVLYMKSLTLVPLLIVLGIILVSFIFAANLQESFSFIPIQQTRKTKSKMNSSCYIPIPVSMANVMPVVYTFSLFAIPQVLHSVLGINGEIMDVFLLLTNQNAWFNPTNILNVVGLVIAIILIIALSLFASELAFSPFDVSNKMHERGDVIPSIRPGIDTEKYLDKYRIKLSIVSSFFLLVIVLIPIAASSIFGMKPMSFLGISLIILMTAFIDMKLRIEGRFKHWNKKYQLFKE